MTSSMHFYLNWAKERIDEMDALLSIIESKAREVEAESRSKADKLVADLREKRDEFQEAIDKQAEAGETAWLRTKAQLDDMWRNFEGEAQKYVESFGKQAGQQQQIFQKLAAAQLKAWQDAAEITQSVAAEFQTKRGADIDTMVAQFKTGASDAEARFRDLQKAGTESWTSLNAALSESRKAFDRANETFWDVFRRSSTEK